MSMFGPSEQANAAEIEKAIRTARRERALMFAELLGLGLASVKDAVLPADEEKLYSRVTLGTKAPRRA